MHPVYGDYWLAGGVSTVLEYGYDYSHDHEQVEDDYDVYLFWPSIEPHALVPANHAEGLEEELQITQRQPPEELPPYSTTETVTDDELDALDLGLESGSDVLNFSPTVTYTFDPNFCFPEPDSTRSLGENGYSRLFRVGLISSSRRFTSRLDGLLKGVWKKFMESLRRFGFWK
ncbi:hypothetical protein BDY19DRAFT_510709 [Irpex rosettiformis]|uniref:Uncharacterized protein n=1 Tax=Irpex rosettiformis TaxID=378272 RepID=A0ACB8UF01_9APHY|nr:hypothetical protein BDY19DRAFT_510709 [Irpex rosettiformis]